MEEYSFVAERVKITTEITVKTGIDETDSLDQCWYVTIQFDKFVKGELSVNLDFTWYDAVYMEQKYFNGSFVIPANGVSIEFPLKRKADWPFRPKDIITRIYGDGYLFN